MTTRTTRPATTTRYVALLRGINVGGHNKVPMAELRALLADIGYIDAKTLLQSGNAVFTAPTTPTDKVAKAVEAALAAKYGTDIAVMVRTADEIQAVVDANPLDVGHPSQFLVVFYADPFDRTQLEGFDPGVHAPEEMAFSEREIYYNFPKGMRDAKLPLVVERRLKVRGTGRNWATVTKLLALAQAEVD
ncbi:DUF1697 domain-containing protein [Yinghuangia sp. YIM S09857]|uniref:DUF1697 domain-containing protein n=1 Tax=Yinghuangia sp. YIM S09857 TaxID=3436929 RepID=UPI003F532F5C